MIILDSIYHICNAPFFLKTFHNFQPSGNVLKIVSRVWFLSDYDLTRCLILIFIYMYLKRIVNTNFRVYSIIVSLYLFYSTIEFS